MKLNKVLINYQAQIGQDAQIDAVMAALLSVAEKKCAARLR